MHVLKEKKTNDDDDDDDDDDDELLVQLLFFCCYFLFLFSFAHSRHDEQTVCTQLYLFLFFSRTE